MRLLATSLAVLEQLSLTVVAARLMLRWRMREAAAWRRGGCFERRRVEKQVLEFSSVVLAVVRALM